MSGAHRGAAAPSSLEVADSVTELVRCFICYGRVTEARMCPVCSKLCCRECVLQWLRVKGECPYCRTRLNEGSLVIARFMDDVIVEIDRLHKLHRLHGTAGISPAHHGHSVSSGGSKPSAAVLSRDAMCPEHTGTPLSYWCTSCGRPACGDCALFSDAHRGHSFEKLAELHRRAAASLRQELRAVVPPRLARLRASRARFEARSAALVTAREARMLEVQQAVRHINDRFDQEQRKLATRQAVVEREVALLESLAREAELQLDPEICPPHVLVAKLPEFLATLRSQAVAPRDRRRRRNRVDCGGRRGQAGRPNGAQGGNEDRCEEEDRGNGARSGEEDEEEEDDDDMDVDDECDDEVGGGGGGGSGGDAVRRAKPLPERATAAAGDSCLLRSDLVPPWVWSEPLRLPCPMIGPPGDEDGAPDGAGPGEPHFSPELEYHGCRFRLKVYLRGNGPALGTHVSVFVEMGADSRAPAGAAAPPGTPVRAQTIEYTLELVHPTRPRESVSRTFTSDFEPHECWGYSKFQSLATVNASGLRHPDGTLCFRFGVRAPSYRLLSELQGRLLQSYRRDAKSRSRNVAGGTTDDPSSSSCAAAAGHAVPVARTRPSDTSAAAECGRADTRHHAADDPGEEVDEQPGSGSDGDVPELAHLGLHSPHASRADGAGTAASESSTRLGATAIPLPSSSAAAAAAAAGSGAGSASSFPPSPLVPAATAAAAVAIAAAAVAAAPASAARVVGAERRDPPPPLPFSAHPAGSRAALEAAPRAAVVAGEEEDDLGDFDVELGGDSSSPGDSDDDDDEDDNNNNNNNNGGSRSEGSASAQEEAKEDDRNASPRRRAVRESDEEADIARARACLFGLGRDAAGESSQEMYWLMDLLGDKPDSAWVFHEEPHVPAPFFPASAGGRSDGVGAGDGDILAAILQQYEVQASAFERGRLRTAAGEAGYDSADDDDDSVRGVDGDAAAGARPSVASAAPRLVPPARRGRRLRRRGLGIGGHVGRAPPPGSEPSGSGDSSDDNLF